MCCAIWYHLYNLKNVKNTHGGVLILVKLQAGIMGYVQTVSAMLQFIFLYKYSYYQSCFLTYLNILVAYFVFCLYAII